jgi:tRNA (guanine37-N1)-methyltransferase
VTFYVLSLFPEIVESYFRGSIMAKAVEKGRVEYKLVNIRDYSTDKHRSVDDAPYGGGAGMVIMPEPLAGALESVDGRNRRTIYPSPSGRVLDSRYAQELSEERDLVLICGRYEGIDQRIIDEYVDDEICVGDYVLSSGEVAALVVIDSVYRLLEGVLTPESLHEESFTDGLLEYPQYTRPELFGERRVPEVLLSGHHERIQKWRLWQRLKKTERNRPDLIAKMGQDYDRLLNDLKEME